MQNVGEIPADFTLVHQAGEAAGAGEHAEQRDFGQTHGRGAVVHQVDLFAGQRQFIAATGSRAVAGGDPVLAVAAGVLDGKPRFIGELAEVHFKGVAGGRQHVDVGAGGEDALVSTGEDDGAHFGVFEAEALDGVGQFDIHAEVVRVEFEFVAGGERRVLRHGQGHEGERRLDVEPPVFVSLGTCFQVDSRGECRPHAPLWPRARKRVRGWCTERYGYN